MHPDHTPLSKLCRKCNTTKSLDEFMRDKGRPDGRHSVCKECKRSYNRSDKGKEAVKRYVATTTGEAVKKAALDRYRKSPQGKASRLRQRQRPDYAQRQAEYAHNSRARHPEKHRARTAVKAAMNRKDLPHARTQLCIQCGKQARDWHHHKGYAPEHWLDVIPLCLPCHKATHKQDHP